MKRTLTLCLASLVAAACSSTTIINQIVDSDGGTSSDSGSTESDAHVAQDSGGKDAATQGDSASTVDSGITPDASALSDSSVVLLDSGIKPDSGPKPDAGQNACYDSNSAQAYVWQGPSAAHQGKCTAQQISKTISECIDGLTATQAKCDAYQASAGYSKDCDRCISGAGKGDDANSIKPLNVAVVLPITVDGTNYAILNTDACAAAALNLGGTCGNPVTQIVACEFGSCQACTDATVDACITDADADVCKPQIDAIQTSCLDKIAAGKATWEPACTGGKTTFQDILPVMATYMCGN